MGSFTIFISFLFSHKDSLISSHFTSADPPITARGHTTHPVIIDAAIHPVSPMAPIPDTPRNAFFLATCGLCLRWSIIPPPSDPPVSGEFHVTGSAHATLSLADNTSSLPWSTNPGPLEESLGKGSFCPDIKSVSAGFVSITELRADDVGF